MELFLCALVLMLAITWVLYWFGTSESKALEGY